MLTAKQSYDEIKAFIDRRNRPYSNWYAGITSDIQSRLFGDHNIIASANWSIHNQCVDNESARDVEKALLALGCEGDVGGGDDSSTYVYAYLIAPNTRP